MTRSSGFDSSVVRHPEENQYIDFKSRIPKMSTEIETFKFMRHVIAFANVAYRTGKPARIVFGIREGPRKIIGIGHKKYIDDREIFVLEDQFPGKNKPRGWDNPNVTIGEKMIDGVEKVIIEKANVWIEPLPELKLEFGEINNVLVAYLEIRPEYPSHPYRLKKSIKDDEDNFYRPGTVFFRRGSSTFPMPDQEVSNLLPASKIPYLDEKDWQKMIAPLQTRVYEEAHSLIQQFPLVDEESGQNALDLILEMLEGDNRIIEVSGVAGSGKSVLLHALTYELASRHNFDNLTSRESLEVIPKHPVPIHLPLRARFESSKVFENMLLRQMKLDEMCGTLENVFKIPGSRWVLLLDALDEAHNGFNDTLQTWLGLLPSNVQVVVSTRPVTSLEHTINVRLKPLDAARAKGLIDVKLKLLNAERNLSSDKTEDHRAKIRSLLNEHPEIMDLIFAPRAVDGLIYQVTEIDPETKLIDRPMMSVESEAAYSKEDNHQNEKPDSPNQQGAEKHLELPTLSPDELINDTEDSDADADENTNTEKSIPEDEEDETVSISFVTVFSGIVEYLRTKEAERQKTSVLESEQELDNASSQLEELAWHKNWDTEEFAWRGKWKEYLKENGLKWNRYIGFIERIASERYRYLSLFFQSFCAANYGFRGVVENYMEEDNLIETLNNKKEHEATEQVRVLLNWLMEENGRDPICIEQEV